MANEIPIRNIYYMLSYAYDVLNEGDNVNLSNEEFDNILIDYMSEGTILGNLARLSKHINQNGMCEQQAIVNDNDEYTYWQFGVDDND